MWTQLKSVLKSIRAVIQNIDTFVRQLNELNEIKEKARRISQEANKCESKREDSVKDESGIPIETTSSTEQIILPLNRPI